MLDRAQRVLVHRVAVIEIAEDQGIDPAELWQDFRQQTQPLQRPQRHAWVVGAKDVSQCGPTHGRIFYRKFRMHHDVRNTAFRTPAQRHTSAGHPGIPR